MVEPGGTIAFDQFGLGSILKQFRLEVPTNQREYSWKTEHVDQLFDDFAQAINDDDDYFLGSIVTIPRKDGTLEVVDGQQRLATTAILLSAVRDFLKNTEERVLVESIDNEFLTGIDRQARQRVPKLTLNVDDNELFGRIVRGGSDPLPEPFHDSHERLIAAYKQARARVGKIVGVVADEKAHGDFLNRWVSFVEHKALVVLLRVTDGANAYKMFETLNDRGLRTSQADLIKNYLFGISGNRLSEVQARWSYMRGTLESLDEDDITINFLRHALIVLRGYLTAAKVYDGVQREARSETSTVAFTTNLEAMATVYAASLSPEHEKWNTYPENVGKAIEAFNLFNIKPLRPLVLAIGTRMAPAEVSACYRYLVAVGVRLMVASTTRSGSVEQPLAEAAHRVWAEEITTVDQLRTSLNALVPGDDDFQSAFAIAKVSNQKLARYYLRSIESVAQERPNAWYVMQTDPETINLEHILPRRPDGHWPGVDDEMATRLATRLGNLALMRKADNSEAKSLPFEDKRAIYGESPYVLTNQLAEAERWDADTIKSRQMQMAKLAVKAWSVK